MIKKIFVFIIIAAFYGCSEPTQDLSYLENINKDTLDDIYIEENNDEIPLIKDRGVYKCAVLINGCKMFFYLDSGASDVQITGLEAGFLFKQGTLTIDDIGSKTNYMDANGVISVGTKINLREVTLGNKTIKNVDATVVNNIRAPLLLGQSALEKFGNYSIDYDKFVLTFK